MDTILRWLLLPVGVSLQFVVYLVYPFINIYFRKKGYKNTEPLVIPEFKQPGDLKWLAIQWEYDMLRLNTFLDNTDDHVALTHSLYWAFDTQRAARGLKAFVKYDNSLCRRYPDDTTDAPISGDGLSSWTFSIINSKADLHQEVVDVAMHYIKNVFGLKSKYGYVPAKCSNGGFSFTKDGGYYLNYPAFIPQFYTTLPLLALACRDARGFKRLFLDLVYIFYFIAFGGWFWPFFDMVHNENHVYYAQHVTMLNLYSMIKLKGNTWYYRWPMKRLLNNTPPNINPLFYALYLDATKEQADPETWNKSVNILLSFRGYYGFMWQLLPSATTGNYFANHGKEFSAGSFVAKLLLDNNPNKLTT